MSKEYRIIEKHDKYYPQVKTILGWMAITHDGRVRNIFEIIFGMYFWSIERARYTDAMFSIQRYKEGYYRRKTIHIIKS